MDKKEPQEKLLNFGVEMVKLYNRALEEGEIGIALAALMELGKGDYLINCPTEFRK